MSCCRTPTPGCNHAMLSSDTIIALTSSTAAALALLSIWQQQQAHRDSQQQQQAHRDSQQQLLQALRDSQQQLLQALQPRLQALQDNASVLASDMGPVQLAIVAKNARTAFNDALAAPAAWTAHARGLQPQAAASFGGGSGSRASQAADSANSATTWASGSGPVDDASQAAGSADAAELSGGPKGPPSTKKRARRSKGPKLDRLFTPDFGEHFVPGAFGMTGTRSHLIKRDLLKFARSSASAKPSKELSNLCALLLGSGQPDGCSGSALDVDSERNLVNLIKSLELSFDDYDFVFEPLLPHEVKEECDGADPGTPFFAFWKVRVLNRTALIDARKLASTGRTDDDGAAADDDADGASLRPLGDIDGHIAEFDVEKVSLRALFATYIRGLVRPGKPCAFPDADDRDTVVCSGMTRAHSWLNAYKHPEVEDFEAAKRARDAVGPSMKLIENWFESLPSPRVVG